MNFYIKIFYAVIILIFCSSCALRERIPLGYIPQMPESTIRNNSELKLYADKYSSDLGIKPEAIFIRGKTTQKVQNSIDRILKANGFNATYRAIIINDETVNASTDDKVVHMHNGLLKNLKKQSDIDAIVSHELAHISCQHIRQKEGTLKKRKLLVDLLSLAVGIAVASSQRNSDPYIQHDTGQVAVDTSELVNKIGDSVFIKPYGRDQELEADEVGLMMAAKAGTNPNDIIEFWSNAQNYLGQDSFNILTSTHPSHASRHKNLLRALPVAQSLYNQYQDEKAKRIK